MEKLLAFLGKIWDFVQENRVWFIAVIVVLAFFVFLVVSHEIRKQRGQATIQKRTPDYGIIFSVSVFVFFWLVISMFQKQAGQTENTDGILAVISAILLTAGVIYLVITDSEKTIWFFVNGYEGRAQVIVKGAEPVGVVAPARNKQIDKETTEINNVPGARGLVTPGFSIFGRYWKGFVGIYKIYRRQMDWLEWKTDPENGKQVLEPRSEETKFLYLTPFTFAIFVDEAEDSDKNSVEAKITIVLEPVNVYMPLFQVADWDKQMKQYGLAKARNFIGQTSFEYLRSEEDDDTEEDIFADVFDKDGKRIFLEPTSKNKSNAESVSEGSQKLEFSTAMKSMNEKAGVSTDLGLPELIGMRIVSVEINQVSLGGDSKVVKDAYSARKAQRVKSKTDILIANTEKATTIIAGQGKAQNTRDTGLAEAEVIAKKLEARQKHDPSGVYSLAEGVEKHDGPLAFGKDFLPTLPLTDKKGG